MSNKPEDGKSSPIELKYFSIWYFADWPREVFLSSDETLPDNKKLNTDIWYDAKTLIWLKARFVKQGNWEYRLKKLN